MMEKTVKNTMITRNTLIEDIVNKYPELIKPLMDFGIVCIACGEPVWGTLEEQAVSAGVKNIDFIVDQLNKNLKNATGEQEC